MRNRGSIGAWAVIAGLLFWNGVLALGFLIPALGRDAGEMMGLFIAMIIIFRGSRPLLAKEPELPRSQVMRVALLWMVLTAVFELAMGRLASLGDRDWAPRYGMLDGSFWPLVVLCAGLAPMTWLRRGGARVPVTK